LNLKNCNHHVDSGINSWTEKGAHRRRKFSIMPYIETPIVDTLRKSKLTC
jgi:hypothetical protein